MKSVIAQGATVAKAIEEALKKADMPKEFFVKLLEDAQAGFLGFGAKKAKIALFFKEEVSNLKHQTTMFESGSYQNLFNNPNIKKQIEQQLKDLGLEIKPIVTPKKSTAVQGDTVISSPSKMHTRPLPNKPGQTSGSKQSKQVTLEQVQVRPIERNLSVEPTANQPQSDEFRRKKRSRYFRPRSRSLSSNQDGQSMNPSSNKSKSDGSDF